MTAVSEPDRLRFAHHDQSRGARRRRTPARLAVSRSGGTVVVDVDGHVVGSSSAHLEHVLRDLIEHQGNLDVVVDLHDVDHADPEGLAVLVAASQMALGLRDQEGSAG